jgi:histidinol-phosphate aminotransferase
MEKPVTQRELHVVPNPVVAEMEPYTGAPPDPLIELKLDSNESLSPVPPLDENRWVDGDWRPNRYLRTTTVEDRLARRFGVARDRVVVTAGADDAIERSVRAVCRPGCEAVVTVPAFEVLERYVLLAGATLVRVPWWRDDFPVSEVLSRATPDTALVFVVSPNNPTGAVASRRTVEELARRLPQALILVDHAYVEYASPEHDLTTAALSLPNVVVFRTFSKAWGAAGLRVGYALGDPRVMGWLRTLGQPYPVAAPSLAMVDRLLQHNATPPPEPVAKVQQHRQRLTDVLAELGVESLPSHANFVLARFADSAWVCRALISLGIGVRPFEGRGELERWLRITLPADNDAFARLEHGLRTVLAPGALLFDLDGVIADVSGSYREAIRRTASSFGVELEAGDIARAKAAGNSNNDWELTRRLLSERGVSPSLDDVVAAFEALYQGRDGTAGLHLAESLLAAPEDLRRMAANRPLGIVTGRPRADARRFLDRHGISDCFAALVTMEDGPAKPDPAPVLLALEKLATGRAWMIGDTPDDVASARAAGVLPIGVVAPGDPSESESALLAAGAARVLANVGQLEGVLP